MEQWFSDARAYLHAHRQSLVTDLMKLIEIPSVAGEKEGDLPFGKEVDRALQAAAKLFDDNGFSVKVCHQDGYALAVLDGGGDGIGIFAHCDVVPVNDDWIKTKPFEPIEENGVIYGRGVADNKAAVVEALYALLALRSANVPLRNRIVVYLGGCEEAGMGDIRAFVKKERMPGVSIVPDGSFPVGIGEKSILRVTCRSMDTLQDVLQLDGGKAFNTVLDHVQVLLRGGTSFDVAGLPAHASRPAAGVNAAVKAAEQLLSMPICDHDKKILSAFSYAAGDCHGGNLNITSEGAFGKLTCTNGIARIENKHLVFTLDIRFGVEMDNDECLHRLSASMEALGFTTEVWESKQGFLLDENAPELQTILGVCRELYDQPDAKPRRLSGGTYARMLKNAYSIDAVPDPVPGLPKGHGGPHQSDEAAAVDSIVKTTEALALMIARLDARF